MLRPVQPSAGAAALEKTTERNNLCHTWLPGDPAAQGNDPPRLLTGTNNGEVLYYENFELRGVLPCSPGDGRAIEAIVALGAQKGGFLGNAPKDLTDKMSNCVKDLDRLADDDHVVPNHKSVLSDIKTDLGALNLRLASLGLLSPATMELLQRAPAVDGAPT